MIVQSNVDSLSGRIWCMDHVHQHRLEISGLKFCIRAFRDFALQVYIAPKRAVIAVGRRFSSLVVAGLQGHAWRRARCGCQGHDILRGVGGSEILGGNQSAEVVVFWQKHCSVLRLCAWRGSSYAGELSSHILSHDMDSTYSPSSLSQKLRLTFHDKASSHNSSAFCIKAIKTRTSCLRVRFDIEPPAD